MESNDKSEFDKFGGELIFGELSTNSHAHMVSIYDLNNSLIELSFCNMHASLTSLLKEYMDIPANRDKYSDDIIALRNRISK
jgi:hypothetical protein